MNLNNRDIRIPGIRTWVEIFEAIQEEHDRQVSVPFHAVVAITDEDMA